MSEQQGLSIFDDEPEETPEQDTDQADVEKTQVIPRLKRDEPAPAKAEEPPAERTQQIRRSARPAKPVIPPARPSSRPRPAQPAPAAAGAGPGGGSAGFPVVRRGGYDKAAVDARLRQLAQREVRARATA